MELLAHEVDHPDAWQQVHEWDLDVGHWLEALVLDYYMRMSREKMTMCLSFQGASNLPLMCSWVMLLSNRVSPAKFRSKLAIFFLELPSVGPLAYSFCLKLTTFVFLSKFVYFLQR